MSEAPKPDAPETWTLGEIRLAATRTFARRISCCGETFEERLLCNNTYRLVAEFAWRIRNRSYEPGAIGIDRLLELGGDDAE